MLRDRLRLHLLFFVNRFLAREYAAAAIVSDSFQIAPAAANPDDIHGQFPVFIQPEQGEEKTTQQDEADDVQENGGRQGKWELVVRRVCSPECSRGRYFCCLSARRSLCAIGGHGVDSQRSRSGPLGQK